MMKSETNTFVSSRDSVTYNHLLETKRKPCASLVSVYIRIFREILRLIQRRAAVFLGSCDAIETDASQSLTSSNPTSPPSQVSQLLAPTFDG